MAVTTTYLSGGRIQGRSDDTLETAIPQTSWKELARTTLSSTSATIDSGTFTAKDNLMILYIGVYNSTYVQANLEVGNGTIDTGDNYAYRQSRNGETDQTYNTQPRMFYFASGASGSDEFGVCTIRNVANKEKICVAHGMNTGDGGNGSGNVPDRAESIGKWVNTSNQINRVQVRTANLFGVGSEIVVLGCDDDEADSGTNFFQELANPTNLASAGDTLNSGTFTAKDYLLVNVFRTRSGSVNSRVQFNGDTGSNYAHRNFGASNSYGNDGETDGGTSIHSHALTSHDSFTTYIMVNKASREKQMIISEVNRNTAGAGNAPDRIKAVAKWANTSNAITSINVLNTDSGNLDVGTSIRVWGGTPT